ncbi:MAG: hypothetical protein NZ823_05320 [Blastocatellia bacterium]|nr:hypothetical protein [Blastocatellia bacterium]
MSTYTKGTLDLSTFAGIGFLRGSGKRFVDDREWHQTNCAGGFGAGPFPFDPDATDQLGVSISLLDHRITLTFANGAQRTIQAPQCANGVMYGFSDAPGTLLPGTMYVLSLKRATVPK